MKRTILLADDSPTIQRLVTQTFADSNFEVISVSNGDAAIRKLEDIHPHLVLADIYMPGKNGFEVCAYIRNHAELSATPVILLVGAFDAFDEGTARQAGASANITKPFEPQVLVDLVVSLLPAEAQEPKLVAQAVQAAAAPAVAPPPATREPATPGPTEEKPKDDLGDLLGLEELFKPAPETPSAGAFSDADIERIADRVIQKLSTQVIESVAWDVVPDITAKVLREELKRQS